MNTDPQLSNEHDVAISEPSEREQISSLVANARLLMAAEIKFYRERLLYSQAILKRSGLFGALALFFLFGAIVALVLGILLTLASRTGPEIATIVATSGFVAIAALFAWLARAKLRKLSFPELETDPEEADPEIIKANDDG